MLVFRYVDRNYASSMNIAGDIIVVWLTTLQALLQLLGLLEKTDQNHQTVLTI